MDNFKTIKLIDGGGEKTFNIRRLNAIEFCKTTNILLSLISKTAQINPDLIRQFVFILLKNGNIVNDLNPEKVEDAVLKEINVNLFGFGIDLIQSILLDIDQHDDKILDCFLPCVFFQNYNTQTPLSKYPGEGYINVIIQDGTNVYKLLLAVFEHNYRKFYQKYIDAYQKTKDKNNEDSQFPK